MRTFDQVRSLSMVRSPLAAELVGAGADDVVVGRCLPRHDRPFLRQIGALAPLELVGLRYIGTRLGLARLRQQIETLPAETYWQALAKVALGDDLAGLQRSIAQGVFNGGAGDPTQLMAAWEVRSGAGLERAQRLLAELGETKGADLAMLSVALRELRNLA